MLQCVTVCCSVVQCVAVCCSVLQCVAVCCSVLQCDAVCCSVLQCDAVCCSVLPHLLDLFLALPRRPSSVKLLCLLQVGGTSVLQCVAVSVSTLA